MRTPAQLLAVVLSVAGCAAPGPTAPPSPSADPAPSPAAPTVRWAQPNAFIVTGASWAFHLLVDPGGSPTSIVLETSSAMGEHPEFTGSILVAEDVVDPGPLSVAITLDDEPRCVRMTATNVVGSASTDPICRPSIRPTEPDGPSSPSPSA